MRFQIAALLIATVPSWADSRGFHEIRKGDRIALVLPGGECDARVVGRQLDSVTVRLNKSTSVCGPRKSLIQVFDGDVRDLVAWKASSSRTFDRGTCGKIAAGVGVPTALDVGIRARSGLAGGAVIAASIAGGALLCRDR